MSKQNIEDWVYNNVKARVDGSITFHDEIELADIIYQYTKNLKDRLSSSGRKIAVKEDYIKKIKQDHKALAGLVKDLRNRNRMLKALLSRMADETQDGHDKIEAWRAIAEDCKHLD